MAIVSPLFNHVDGHVVCLCGSVLISNLASEKLLTYQLFIPVYVDQLVDHLRV